MQQVTSFSASLLSSLAGDTDKAADVANMALIDISDNANKMGSSLESVTLAYQGFAKGQYMLLDNLKLGYGGTKTEMERLLKDAQALTGVKYDINNLADVYSAIHAIQEQLGITETTMKEAETTITGSLGMVKSSWQNLLTAMSGGGDLDRAINNFVYSLEKFTANIVPAIERTLLGLGQAIQRTLPMLVQTVVTALVQQIPNLVVAVYNMIVGLFKGIILGIKALFTGGTAKATEVIKGNVEIGAKNTEQMAENMKKTAEETKKAGKEAKKSLAAFDELNILSSGASGGAGAGETPEASTPTISASGGGVTGVGGIGAKYDNSFVDKIDVDLAAIMGYVGFALAAIGIILICFGHIGWGIGFLIAGAAIFSVSQAALSEGAELEKVKNIMNGVIAGISLLALVLGIILVCTTKNPKALALGIGLIVVGAAGLATEIALNWNAIKENIQKFFTENGWLIAGVSLALLVIGVLLCFAQIWGLGIGLIAAGAAGLVAVVAINWDSIKTAVVNAFNAVINWVKTWGLLVLGIILTLTGNFALGIPLIVAGAMNLTEAQDPLWTAVVDKVKEVWGKVKDFWNKNIAPVFTAQWWGNLAKNAINGFIRWIINGLNKLVDKLNSFGFKLPDILGGGRIGFNIPRLSIPQLAQGAVLPPNKPFLAMVGDQKNGTNIEAPLDTIVEAMNIALSNNNGGFNGRIEVPVIVDGREIARAVREAENRMGSQSITGGFANAY
jgi:uncharacterized protein YpuA (DUF1002 family)